ncbi:MAG: hypothetical protein MK364_22995, partial [Pirellulales bacterium]|nr:hypothetical protein [Pirellulales bacterium]
LRRCTFPEEADNHHSDNYSQSIHLPRNTTTQRLKCMPLPGTLQPRVSLSLLNKSGGRLTPSMATLDLTAPTSGQLEILMKYVTVSSISTGQSSH